MDHLKLTLKEQIDLLIDNKLFDAHTCIPAKIESVDYENQRLDAKIAINQIAILNNREEILEYPTLRGIPFFTLQGGNLSVTVPPKVDDTCLLIFCERNSDLFWKTGKISAPSYAQRRKHNINDAVAIVGFNAKSELIPNYSSGDIELRNDSRDICVSLNENRINIKAKSASEFLNDEKIEIKKGEDSVEVFTNDKIEIKKGADCLEIFTNDKIEIKKGENSIAIIDGAKVEIRRGNNSIAITDEGIYLQSQSAVFVQGQDVTVSAKNNLNLNAISSVNLNSNTINLSATDIHMTATATAIESNMNITGAVSITGDLDATAIKGVKTTLGTGEPTPGYLYSGNLDDFSVFMQYLSEDGVHCTLVIDKTEIDIAIPHEKFIGETPEISDYEQLAAAIQSCSNLYTCEYSHSSDLKKQLIFTTVGKGTQEGYISYLHDIEDHSGDTHGILYTGELPTWDSFKISLDNKGLAFKINIGGILEKFEVPYDVIDPMEDFDHFAQHLNGLLSSEVAVSFATSKLIFATVRTGSFDGQIGYLQNTDTTASGAELIGGKINLSWEGFIEKLAERDCAVKCSINGNDYIFHLAFDDIQLCGNFANFFSKFLVNSEITNSYDEIANSVIVNTHSVGAGTTISFFSDVDKISAQNPYLITGTLPPFISVKNTYASQTLAIEFFIETNENSRQFLITPDDLKQASTWNDIATLLSNDDWTLTYNETGRFIFTSTFAGKAEISYLKHTPDTEKLKTIDGALLLYGTETLAFKKFDGMDEIINIAQSADSLGLTQSSGATVIEGKDNEFNSNSSILLKGIPERGAQLYPGQDGTITVINNSATLLKGTALKGATIVAGSDSGEVPEPYDGIITIVGDVHVTNELRTRVCTVTDEMNATGVIEFNPKDPETQKESSVMVHGGINASKAIINGLTSTQALEVSNYARTKDLTVQNNAVINHLTVNNGVTITGDLNIDSGSINSNGVQLSFSFIGMTCNRPIYAPDVFVM